VTGADYDHLRDLRDAARAVTAPYLATDSRPNAVLDRKLWDELRGLGLIGLGASEAVGGSGGTLLDVTTVLAELTRARLPYAEAVLVGTHLLGNTGIAVPDGTFTAGRVVLTALPPAP